MSEMNETEARNYLLGKLPEFERETLESKALQHEEAYETIRAVEIDLFDDFARGRLAPAERQAFLERYGREEDRIGVARALSRRTENVVAFPKQPWMGWAAAAAIVVVVGSVLIRTVVDTPTAAPDIPSPRRVIVTPPAANITPPMIAAITLGGSRSATSSPVVMIPKNVETVRFRVRLNAEDRFDRYALDLSPVWRVDGLQAAAENGELVIFADIPANVLKSGKYDLAVHGNGEDLGFVTVEVLRTE